MVWHKSMATLFLILLFGAMAFTTPSRADNFEGHRPDEENASPSLTAEQMSQQLIRWPWKKSRPPPPHGHLPQPGHKPPKAPSWKPWKKSPPLPPHGHLPPPYEHLPPPYGHLPPPKAPWWKPWKKSPPAPKPPRRPWWKPPCCGRKKPPPPAF